MAKVLAPSGPIKRSGKVLLAGLLACAVLSVASAASPVSKASAGPQFCFGYLAPWGQNGDRCDAPNQGNGRLAIVKIYAYQRAGCVTYIGWYGEYHHSWSCTSANSEKSLYVPYNSGWHRGAIRNNNKTYGAEFGGFHICYAPTSEEYWDCAGP
jgi:hypothetical protein